jgi:Gpi16 subunit, GPI transamidase component
MEDKLSTMSICQEEHILLSAFYDTTTLSNDSLSHDNDLVVDVHLSVRGQLDAGGRRNVCFLRPDIFEPLKHPLIESVHMSITSHPTRTFPQSPLDDYQRNIRQHHLSSSSSPPGFSITVEPIDGLTSRAVEAEAVRSLVHDWIQKRILTTPLVGGMWDVIEERNPQEHLKSKGIVRGNKRKYQIILPFDGSAWSADALSQSFQATLSSSSPRNSCRVNSISKKNDLLVDDSQSHQDIQTTKMKNVPRFFGWSSLEWSQFLVGEGASASIGVNESPATKTDEIDGDSMYYPAYKQMWWTAKRSQQQKQQQQYNSVVTEFGIRYQSRLPSTAPPSSLLSSPSSSWKSWIPVVFWREPTSSSTFPSSLCSRFNIHRPQITILAPQHSSPIDDDQIDVDNADEGPVVRVIPLLNKKNDDETYGEAKDSVTIHQVVRRHSNNRGRFESQISIDPSQASECELTYRQIIPKFMTPSWRSLHINTQDTLTSMEESPPTTSWTAISPQDESKDSVEATVEWNAEYQNSVLYVKLPSTSGSLPMSVTITMEYEPTFLTLDDFPGDPNRGQTVPPGKVTKWCPANVTYDHQHVSPRNHEWVMSEFYSNAMLLIPPVPDLSMPFNVISLTSSFYAYIVGTLITVLIRKGSERIKYKMYPDKKPKSGLSKLRNKLSLLSFGKGKRNVSKIKSA